MSKCQRKDPHTRAFVDWVIRQVLFQDMSLSAAKVWFEMADVPDPVFDRLFQRAEVE